MAENEAKHGRELEAMAKLPPDASVKVEFELDEPPYL